MRENNGFDDVVKLVAPLLALVGLVLGIAGLTDLGQVKAFRFVFVEMAVITAIAYSFQTACRVHKFAPFGIVIWFSIVSMNVAQAVWFVAR